MEDISAPQLIKNIFGSWWVWGKLWTIMYTNSPLKLVCVIRYSTGNLVVECHRCRKTIVKEMKITKIELSFTKNSNCIILLLTQTGCTEWHALVSKSEWNIYVKFIRSVCTYEVFDYVSLRSIPHNNQHVLPLGLSLKKTKKCNLSFSSSLIAKIVKYLKWFALYKTNIGRK